MSTITIHAFTENCAPSLHMWSFNCNKLWKPNEVHWEHAAKMGCINPVPSQSLFMITVGMLKNPFTDHLEQSKDIRAFSPGLLHSFHTSWYKNQSNFKFWLSFYTQLKVNNIDNTNSTNTQLSLFIVLCNDFYTWDLSNNLAKWTCLSVSTGQWTLSSSNAASQSFSDSSLKGKERKERWVPWNALHISRHQA